MGRLAAPRQPRGYFLSAIYWPMLPIAARSSGLIANRSTRTVDSPACTGLLRARKGPTVPPSGAAEWVGRQNDTPAWLETGRVSTASRSLRPLLRPWPPIALHPSHYEPHGKSPSGLLRESHFMPFHMCILSLTNIDDTTVRVQDACAFSRQLPRSSLASIASRLPGLSSLVICDRLDDPRRLGATTCPPPPPLIRSPGWPARWGEGHRRRGAGRLDVSNHGRPMEA